MAPKPQALTIYIALSKSGLCADVLAKDPDQRPRDSRFQPPLTVDGIVDRIVTMQYVDFGDGKPIRAMVCASPNAFGYPAKDRSGRLEQIEEPHLGKWLSKLTGKGERKPTSHTIPSQVTTTTEAA